jgi:hypothetical protein
VPYREDLDAALAHAEAAERKLEEARKEKQADEERIAELEGELAAAKRGVHETKLREPKPASPKQAASPAKSFIETSGFSVLLPVVILLLLGLGGLGIRQCGTRGSKDVVDVSGDIVVAKGEALKTIPDPVLTSIRADFVNPAGLADLKAFAGGRVSYVFVSPSRTNVPAPVPTGPIGAPAPNVQYDNCSVSIRYENGRLRTSPTAGRGMGACGEPLASGHPSCSAVDVWSEAIRRGAPSNAVASLRLEMKDVRLPKETARHIAAWRFSIADTSVDFTIPDNCPIAH